MVLRFLRIAPALSAALLIAGISSSAGAGGGAPQRAPGSGDGGVKLTSLGNFDAPVYAAIAPGRANRKLLFVVEQEGAIRVLRGRRVLGRPFADLSNRISTGGERGLLSIAFDPGYARNRLLYAYFTDREGDIRVSQLRRSANSKVLAKQGRIRDVIEIPHSTFPNHNGGQASFGPDGLLYLGTGDGGGSCHPDGNAQNPDSLLGKMLRIAPRNRGGYAIPPGNPFVKGPGADEVYSLGLRNPFRFAFDAKTRAISIADVGQAAWEELNHLKLTAARGANFGWDAYEGHDVFVPPASCVAFDPDPTPPPPGAVAPIHQYGHAGGGYTGCAIIGGPVVRDRRLPTLKGRLLFSDACNGEIQSVVPRTTGGTDPGPIGVAAGSPSSIVAGRNDRVYITDLANGDLLRVDPAVGAANRERAAARRAGDGRGGFRAARLGRFSAPTYVTGPKGANGLLYVTEQAGVIRLVKRGRHIGGKFLDIRRLVEDGGERGLLSMAFPPDFGRTGLFYVYYTQNGGDIVVAEYRRSGKNPRRAEAGSRRTVIRIEHSENSNHNGGQLQFGPDGNLFIGVGDGGGSGDPDENAQNKDSLLGKLLRIDPRRTGERPYSIPDGNPVSGDGGRPEIYSLGLRNPYRFSFDRKGDALIIGDVGQDAREEIDYETLAGARGANFGWDAFEGKRRFESPDASPPPADHVPPIFDYGHSGGRCTIIGGFVSRDPRIRSLFGRYLYADLCDGQIRSLVPKRNGVRGDRKTGLPSESGIATFGEDSRGRIYFANNASGEVFAIKPTGKRGKRP